MNSWCEVLTMDFYKVAFLLGAFICTGLEADQPHNAAGSLCEMSKVDIVMLVDGSGSISNIGFQKMKSFISQVVQNLPIGPDQVQIGLTQFSHYRKTEWDLNSYDNKQTLLQAINSMRQIQGGTLTGQALDHVRNHSFQPRAGMRPDAKKRLVLITDGASFDEVGIPAWNLKSRGIEIYVIGVGPDVYKEDGINQLRTIASENHLYFFFTHQLLLNAALSISSDLCPAAANLEQQGSRCGKSKVDIVILLDGSESITSTEFQKMKSFISQIIQDLPIGPSKVQIGLTQYSHKGQTEWNLNSHNKKQSLLEAIDTVQHLKSIPNTGRALDHVRLHNFRPSAGMRPDAKKKVVLITDGISFDEVGIPARNLKDRGIEIYAIGVGQGIHNEYFLNQLRTIASEDTENHLYLFSTYQSFHNAAINISRNICYDATNPEKQGLQADQTNSTGLQADQTNSTDNIAPLKGYSKTEGTMVLSENRNQYAVKSVTECAARCDSETSFTCKSFAYLEQNQECWTWASNSKTGPVVQNWNSVLYEKNKYLLECVNEKGADYRGTVNRTKSGKLCQRWDAMFPHKAMFTPQEHPLADLESNFCRNPSGILRSPWCYTTDPKTIWELCDIPSCTEECMHCRGEDYKGKISVTENGFTCQRWDSQIPHNHAFVPTVFPEKFLEENYCRNPNADSRPWCYTSSPSRRWDYCSIPRCTAEPPSIIPELSCITGNGESYRGIIAVTSSGKKCQRWASQTPHRHDYTPESYPCSHLAYNFCRNPGKDQRPWCYTTDPETRWEYCNVSRCADTSNPPEPEATFDDTKVKGFSKTEGSMVVSVKGGKYSVKTVTECAAKCNNETSFLCKSFGYVEKDHECWTTASNSKTGTVVHRVGSILYERNDFLLECVKESGTNYRGKQAITKSGKLCQRWEANTPHNPMFKPENYPLADLDSNFCRNPDSKSQGPWCYTTDPDTVWEHCDIPSCTEDCMQPGVDVYKGKTSITENGFICQRWDSLEPHSHGYTPKVFPNKFLEENYCRNPNGDSRPWCYTTSPSKRWDYCIIPSCKSDLEQVCITGRGETFRGIVGVTASGETCQEWAAQTPHYHPSIVPERFPDAGLDINYCRNPDGKQKPWCFTTDYATRWDYCSLPNCNDILASGECMHCNGQDYRGTVSWTQLGFTCQRWDSQTPHQHSAHQVYGGQTLDENYCRNPSKDPLPWCYTTDPAKRWDYCAIPRCSSAPPTITPELNCTTGNGENYRGTISVTENGNKCKRWSETSYTPDTYPCSGLDNNYCRNALGKEKQPWCYISSQKWELCNVQQCYVFSSGDDYYED